MNKNGYKEVGRQDDINDKDCAQIETAAGLGLTVPQIAALLGFAKSSFEKKMMTHDQAKEAIERGRAKAIAKVSETAYQLAVSGKCPAMTMFYLKCRARWKEVHVIDHQNTDGSLQQPQVILHLPKNGRES